MTYDVPLPPCVEKRRAARRRQLEEDNRSYARAGYPLRELDADSERVEIIHGIDFHCSDSAFPGHCERCDDDQWWPVWFSGRALDGRVLPDRTVDIGTYHDAAGHAAVAAGAWDPDMVKTARQIATETFRRMKERP